MNETTFNLSQFRTNNFSQNGEDGVIEKLFEILEINSGYLVEFGAWNGVHLSNTRHHYAKPDNKFKTVLIESSPDRFSELTANVPWNDNNILLNLEVKKEGESSLNQIFKKYSVKDIALLSIDTDSGDDLSLFESLDTTAIEGFRPKVVIIEFAKWKSPQALNKLVSTFEFKGYSLVCVTGNFIFIDDEHALDLGLVIKSKDTVHKLIRKSGSPEYMHYFKQISDERYEELKKQLPGKDIHVSLAGEQIISVDKLSDEV